MYKKITVVGLLMIALTYGIARFGFGLLIPFISKDLNISSPIVGIISSSSYFAYCIAIVLSSIYASRIDPKKFITLSGLTAVIGMLLIATSGNSFMLAIGVFVAGASTGFASPSLGNIVNLNLREDEKNKSNTWINAGTGFGILISGPLSFLMGDDWRNIYVIFIIIGIIILISNLKFIPRSQSYIENKKHYKIISIFKLGLKIIISSFILGFCSSIYWTFSKVYIDQFNTPNESILFWMIVGISGIIGGFSSSIGEKVGNRTTYLIVVIMISLAMLLITVQPSNIILIDISAFLFGSSYILLTGIYILWGIKIFPEEHSIGIGLPFLVLAIGQLVGSIVSGLSIDLVGYKFSFIFFSILSLNSLFFKPINKR
ncbi:MFS transporter [Macrococcoides canis]|uniref:MFS transporter n=1 Tax=Macrococcoides canis TaxID=1855823 RepID=UPI001F18CB4A|nr:MFS transporter [Macrococcus canis]MCO4097482.1 MFS transporter [Macrococcus canis]UJS29021.1 MFS transporter [Macrococcus canis]UTH06464.1 MFS transporter [Macrococcus canis]